MMKTLMKAGMLCLFLLTLIAAPVTFGAGVNFGSLIEDADREAEVAHRKSSAATPKSETISRYHDNWFKLRKRKRTMVAQADIRLKPAKRRPAAQ